MEERDRKVREEEQKKKIEEKSQRYDQRKKMGS